MLANQDSVWTGYMLRTSHLFPHDLAGFDFRARFPISWVSSRVCVKDVDAKVFDFFCSLHKLELTLVGTRGKNVFLSCAMPHFGFKLGSHKFSMFGGNPEDGRCENAQIFCSRIRCSQARIRFFVGVYAATVSYCNLQFCCILLSCAFPTYLSTFWGTCECLRHHNAQFSRYRLRCSRTRANFWQGCAPKASVPLGCDSAAFWLVRILSTCRVAQIEQLDDCPSGEIGRLLLHQ